MEAHLIGVHDPRWRRTLTMVEHDFYHRPAYCQLEANEVNGEAMALHVVDRGRTMLLPLVRRAIEGGDYDATSPYGYPGPLLAPSQDQGFLRDALAAGIELLASKSYVTLFVRTHPLLSPRLPEGIGTVVDHPPTVVIDLEQRDEDWWSGMRKSHRQQIGKALDAGHRAYIDQDGRCFDRFKEVYRLTMRRLRAKEQYHFSDRYFDHLRSALGPSLHVCILEHQGRAWAAGLFVETHRIVQSHLSGDDRSHRTGGAKKLMYAHVRDWAKARGDKWLHLGGGAPSKGLESFKIGFSRDRRSFSTLRVVLRPDAYRALVTRANPDSEPGDHTGYFPAYRRAAR